MGLYFLCTLLAIYLPKRQILLGWLSGFQPRGIFWKLGEAGVGLLPPKEGTLTALALFHATWASIPPTKYASHS